MSNLSSFHRIGNYIITKKIGHGSFAKVFEATHELTGRRVAVKVLSIARINAANMAEKIEREISILKLLRHPNIISLYEAIYQKDYIFLVMEYVAGGELFDYIVKKGRISENEARRFAQQIVACVHYCHRNMIVHRDLKPENLLLDFEADPAGRVKICDFDLSNILTEGDFLSTACGSPNYAAPEIIGGRSYVGPGVDVWSIGIILYALLAGHLPFDDDNVPRLFQKINSGIYPPLKDVSEECANFVARLLDVNPETRISLENARHHPWLSQDFPSYLDGAFIENTFTEDIINDEVVDDLVSIGFDRDEIEKTFASRDFDSKIGVAYRLLCDRLADPSQDLDHAPSKSKSGSDHDFSGAHFNTFVRESLTSPNSIEDINNSENKKLFSAGYKVKNSSPMLIINEILSILKDNGFVWKLGYAINTVPGPVHINSDNNTFRNCQVVPTTCVTNRYKDYKNVADNTIRTVKQKPSPFELLAKPADPAADMLMFGVCLYRAEADKSSGSYIVDYRLVHGCHAEFLQKITYFNNLLAMRLKQ